MSWLSGCAMMAALTIAGPVAAESIRIVPDASRPSTATSSPNFTGTAVVQQFYGASDASRSSGGVVDFAPGTRSAWHTHPAGQVLIVLSGTGWIQEWGSPRRGFEAGDVITIPPGVKHWHGATATNAMRHLALQDVVDGRGVDWLEPVTDEQYGT